MQYNTSKTGWNAILRDYVAMILEHFIEEWPLHDPPKHFEMTSGEAFRYVLFELKKLDRTISRASVIFELSKMADMGLLTYRTTTGKGGHHRVYRLAMAPQQLEIYVVTNILRRVKDTWPTAYDRVTSVVR